MQKFIGVKLINAIEMTRQAYNDLRGWKLPEDENGADEGYLVEYIDGGKANTKQFEGCVSWSPKEVFENAYRAVSGLSFGLALEVVKKGGRVAREGWNGKNQFIFLVPGSKFVVNRPPLLGIYPEGTTISYGSHVDIKTTQGEVRPWTASQSDQLADDWYVVEDPAQ
jgi:hypothetical protein